MFKLAFSITTFAAWLTHVIFCLSTGSWGFLIAGAIMIPIGVIHGLMVWWGAAQ